MHKSEQEVNVTFTVTGPDGIGLFIVDTGFYRDTYQEDTEDLNVRQAIRQHLDSMPVPPVEIDGFLIAPRGWWRDVGVWDKDAEPRLIAEGSFPLVVGENLDEVIRRYGVCDSQFRSAYLALIKYFIRKEEGTL